MNGIADLFLETTKNLARQFITNEDLYNVQYCLPGTNEWKTELEQAQAKKKQAQ